MLQALIFCKTVFAFFAVDYASLFSLYVESVKRLLIEEFEQFFHVCQWCCTYTKQTLRKTQMKWAVLWASIVRQCAVVAVPKVIFIIQSK